MCGVCAAAASVPITLALTMYIRFVASVEVRDILGLAWDCGAVTTGPVTVPLVLALGVGVASNGDEDKDEENETGSRAAEGEEEEEEDENWASAFGGGALGGKLTETPNQIHRLSISFVLCARRR